MDCFKSGKGEATMSINTFSLIELKQMAKDKHIKYYYTKSKRELVELLSLPDIPTFVKLQKVTIRTLRQEAKEKSVERIWTKSRQQLVEELYPEYAALLYPKLDNWKDQYAPYKNKQDEGHADKHDHPQEHNS
jgi:hypothetical protein